MINWPNKIRWILLWYVSFHVICLAITGTALIGFAIYKIFALSDYFSIVCYWYYCHFLLLILLWLYNARSGSPLLPPVTALFSGPVLPADNRVSDSGFDPRKFCWISKRHVFGGQSPVGVLPYCQRQDSNLLNPFPGLFSDISLLAYYLLYDCFSFHVTSCATHLSSCRELLWYIILFRIPLH